MTDRTEHWATVERLYHGALARPADQRAAFLADACSGDDDLRREVESLLAQGVSADGRLTQGAVVAAAGLVSSLGESVLTGRRLGSYQILAPLGAGGMGEVYRARDTRLGREVAIKILPHAFTADTDRLARFEREARVLASLNHPHIAAIYGIEEGLVEAGPDVRSENVGAGFSRPIKALVLELVEGETLAERIARAGAKGLPVKETLDIARQIADALDAAHEKGIVHRDLKPANIKITPQGVVKVLDFGLAKLEAGGAGEEGTGFSESPTITVNDTHEGLIVGTAAYMSPEQARGQAVDKRTDIWAFGCVLYEMLSGRSAFVGATVSDTIAKILEREPDWRTLPPTTPMNVRRLLRRCLERDSKHRLRDVGDARIEIDDALSGSAAPTGTEAGGIPQKWLWSLAGGSLVVALVMGIGWGVARMQRAPTQTSTVRLTINAPFGTQFVEDSGVAISPDGRLVAFVARSSSGTSLWVQSLNSLTARVLPGTDDADFPFWSPDSRSIGFFAAGKLKRIDTAGGGPTVICNVGGGRGATWNEEGLIVFNSVNDGPLLRVPATGGMPEPLTMVDRSQGENSHRWPQFLPGGRRILYFVRKDTAAESGIYFGTVDDPRAKVRLLTAPTNAVYVPDRDSKPGHLFWARDGALIAQGFDPASGRLSGDPVRVAEDVAFGNATRLVAASASSNGTVIYRVAASRNYQLSWYDRDGKPLGPLGQPNRYLGSRISPDGKRVAVTARGDVWQMEFSRSILTRVTFDGAGISDPNPIWSPDSQRIGFTKSARGNGNPTLFVKTASGTGADEHLFDSDDSLQAEDWSPDGKFVLYTASSNDLSSRAVDLWLLPVTGDKKPLPFVTTPFREGRGAFSPDGKWIAYTSDESGRNQVYVQSFPAGGSKWQISSNGGDWARWRRDGKELFYVAPNRELLSVGIGGASGSPEFGSPSRLFVLPITLTLGGGQQTPYTYDVMPDGQRFLALSPATSETPPIAVILNWQAELSAQK